MAKGIVRVGEVRLDADGDPVLGNRLIEFSLLTQGLAEVVVEGGDFGLDVDGGEVLGDGFIGLPLHKQGEAEAVMCVRIVGPSMDGVAIGRRGRLQDCSSFR